MTDNNPEILKSLLGTQCPECHKEIILGIGMNAPIAAFVMTPAQLEAKKKQLIEAIDASGLAEPQKQAIKDQYNDKHVMVDPTVADFMIEELKTTYAVKEDPKTAKKSSGAKKATT